MNTNTPQNQITPQTQAEIKAFFEIRTGNKKKTLMVRKDRLVVGSVESADIRLSGPQVAPIHAVIEIQFGASESQCSARVLDLASPSGVQVNGSRVVNQVLKSGDQLTIGSVQLSVTFKRPEAKSLLPDSALLLVEAGQVQPIFDYRPPVKDALEVVASWNNTILNVKHFTQQTPQVSLGASIKQDFMVPQSFISAGEHIIAQQSGGRWSLNVDSKMKGMLYIGGKLVSVEDYRKEKGAVSGLSLGDQDFAKIEVGTLQFYLSQTLAPPTLIQKTTIVADQFLARSLIASVLVTMLLLGGISQIEQQATETVQVPETVATILYHPEKYSIKRPIVEEKRAEVDKTPLPTQPKKAEVDFTKPQEKQGAVAQTKSAQPGKKQEAQNVAKEGEGARAKGAEGSRGAKNAAADVTKQNAAFRTSPRAGEGRGGTQSEAQDHGNVQMLKGATNKILDLLGGSGQKLGKAGSKLSGFGGFATQGNGGLALQGGGKGGGGNADTLLGGLGEKGRGGGKVGTGLGAEGTGSGIVGGKTRVELNAGGGDETVVVGAIDRDAIDAAIRAHRDEFRYCYEKEVNSGQPNLAGKIVTAFVIGGSGRASQMAIASSSMGAPGVERCVLGVISRIQFPVPAGGIPVTVKYPFAFTNSSK